MGSFRKFAKNIPALPRRAAAEYDLTLKIRIVRCDPQAIRRFRQKYGVPLFGTQFCKSLFRKDEAR